MKTKHSVLWDSRKSRYSLFSIAIFLFAATNIGYSMAVTNKYKTYDFKLSSKIVSFSEPDNYSKDFSKPNTKNQTLNIFDPDVYTDSEYSLVLHKAYWDYGRSFFIGKVNGTLSMTVALVRTYETQLNLENGEQFKNALQLDFEHDYDKQTQEDYGITPPEEYTSQTISTSKWVHYKYDSNGEIRSVYSIPLSEQHYLQIIFSFIDNSTGKANDWEQQATSTMNQIMSSFQIK